MAGSYDVSISRDGFETLNRAGVNVGVDAPIELRFALVPKVQLKDTVGHQGHCGKSRRAGCLTTEQLQRGPDQEHSRAATTFQTLFRSFRGLFEIPRARSRFRATGENRSAFIVNSADVTDPLQANSG
jgi:hypothetical protein